MTILITFAFALVAVYLLTETRQAAHVPTELDPVSLGPTPPRVVVIEDPRKQIPLICDRYISTRQETFALAYGETACLVTPIDPVDFAELAQRLKDQGIEFDLISSNGRALSAPPVQEDNR